MLEMIKESKQSLTRVVGISDMKISQSASEVLITYSLGSCVGLSLFDPVRGIGGLVHCLLPLSKISKDKARSNPFMFTDTGVAALLQAMSDLGSTPKELVAKIAGGASPLEMQQPFKIGERNLVVLRKLLWRNSVLISGEDVGGTAPRTMRLYIGSGSTTISSKRTEVEI